MKIVSDITQPLGAKLKPLQEDLNHFGKACESLQVQIIGSILIATLNYEENWKTLIVFFYPIICYLFII